MMYIFSQIVHCICICIHICCCARVCAVRAYFMHVYVYVIIFMKMFSFFLFIIIFSFHFLLFDLTFVLATHILCIMAICVYVACFSIMIVTRKAHSTTTDNIEKQEKNRMEKSGILFLAKAKQIGPFTINVQNMYACLFAYSVVFRDFQVKHARGWAFRIYIWLPYRHNTLRFIIIKAYVFKQLYNNFLFRFSYLLVRARAPGIEPGWWAVWLLYLKIWNSH